MLRVLVLLLAVSTTSAALAATHRADDDIGALVSEVTTSPPKSAQEAGRRLRVNLRLSDADVYKHYRAMNVAFRSLAFPQVDFDEPSKGAAASGKYYLRFSFAGACIRRADILHDYRNMSLRSAPTGHGEHEEWVYGTTMQGVEVTFGFDQRQPGCLSSTAFSYHRHG